MPITTQVDTDNQFSWDTRVQEFDENGVLVASNIVYDNGIEISQTYEMSEGEYSYNHIVTELRIDHNDVTGQTTIFTSTDLVTFNEVQQVTQFDDGRVRTASYRDFYYVTVVEEDLENAYSWTTRTSEGIVQGIAEYYFDVLPLNWGAVDIHLVNDDQTEEFISTDYGIQGSHWIYDWGDQYDWSEKATSITEDGCMYSSIRMDNGLFYSSTSLDGLLTRKIWYDGDDTFNWNVKETYFHVTGQVRGRYIEFDDGVVNVEYYDDGNLTEIIQTDYDNARNWETIDTFYATNGLKSERTTTYDNGIVMLTSGTYPNGIRYEGTEGWIWVSRGSYTASASDPVTQGNNAKALDASDPKILQSVLGENEIKFTRSSSHHGNWLEAIQGNVQLLSPVEIGHRSCSVCLISHIAMKLGRKLEWNSATEEFVNDPEANTYLSRAQRKPWGTDLVYQKNK